MNNIQKAVRGYLSQDDITQSEIRKELGCNIPIDMEKTIQDNHLIFIIWLVDNKKTKEFINKGLSL